MVNFVVTYQKELYLLISAILIFFLYGYCYHMYKSQRIGKKDYEKYSRLALDDNITDTPIERIEKTIK